ncbi:MAG TPA: molybdopterin-dependent oxidoreductase [Actinomycetota bacterium]|nr:molybdopterin-dependent oxidoreductase [Actinomycetota bacterium]
MRAWGGAGRAGRSPMLAGRRGPGATPGGIRWAGSALRRAGRRTNLALAALLALALGTGALGFAVGQPWVRWVLVAHGGAGLAIVLLAPWKQAIALRGLARARPGAWASVALAAVLAVVVLTGLLHLAGLPRSIGGLSPMQLHVGAALASVPLAAWHVLARPVRPRRTDLSRRAVLRAGLLLGGAGVALAGAEGLARALALPGADRRFTGSHEAGSFDPAAMPVTQWLDDPVPEIDPGGYRLVVRDADGERGIRYPELAAFRDRARAVLDCTGGWYAVQDWEGAWLSRLVRPGAARSLVVRSATGYARRFPVGDAPRLLLAVRVGGRPLSAGHGAPARLVAPGRRGFWWVKWVTRIEADGAPWWWQPPFPLT